MPTLRPGCHVVPRWRARILPATTISPPDFFRPRRRPALSRPLREDPPAFLCAIAVLSRIRRFLTLIPRGNHLTFSFYSCPLRRAFWRPFSWFWPLPAWLPRQAPLRL